MWCSNCVRLTSIIFRKVLPNERLDWCYKMVLDALQKDTSSISNDTIYVCSNGCLVLHVTLCIF